MPVHVVVTCKKCKWKTEVPVRPFRDIFGRNFDWQDAKPAKCKGCGYDHGIRISVKETAKGSIRPKCIPAGTDAEASGGEKVSLAKAEMMVEAVSSRLDRLIEINKNIARMLDFSMPMSPALMAEHKRRSAAMRQGLIDAWGNQTEKAK